MVTLKKVFDEKETIEKALEESKEAEQKMQAKMKILADELDRTSKKIEQLQRGNGGYGSRANNRMNFGGNSNYSGGSRNSSNNSRGV
jgi:predicted  nucleic acid-binding Zn-ribbon protein